MTHDAPASLQFNGASNSVKAYADGTLVIHTMSASDQSSCLVVSIQSGTHNLRTLATLKVTAIHGPCRIKVNNGVERTLKTGGKMTIGTGSTFTVSADGGVLRVIPDQGPGFGSPRVPDETVP